MAEQVMVPRSRTPIYHCTRGFLGRRDLVADFYTMKCQFQCSYCTLPLASSNEPVSVEDLNAQIDEVFDTYHDQLGRFQRFTFGNEGSALDGRRFHRASLHRLLERAEAMERLEVLSIETRPEYINRANLIDVQRRTRARTVDVTVGFETQDDHIRLVTLRKSISRRVMEERIALLGELGVQLTSYVMLKPAPRMSEDDGVAEAVRTIEYLAEQTARHGVPFIAYLTPSFVAKGSLLERTSAPGDYLPPTIDSIVRVIAAGHRMGVPLYVGLSNEGLAVEDGDFTARPGYDPARREAIDRYNSTGDFRQLAT